MITTKALTGSLCAVSVLMSSCGSRLSGRYGTEKDGADFDFKSGHRVEITVLGSTRLGSYRLENDKVYITAANDTQVFRLNERGCIEGGFLFGTLCKK